MNFALECDNAIFSENETKIDNMIVKMREFEQEYNDDNKKIF